MRRVKKEAVLERYEGTDSRRGERILERNQETLSVGPPQADMMGRTLNSEGVVHEAVKEGL